MNHIGYLVPAWPSQTHAFFWRELSALRELGHEVTIFSTKRPDPKQCRHVFAEEALRTTRYLLPPRMGKVLMFLLKHPVRTVKALTYIGGLRQTSILGRLRLVALTACAADLVSHVQHLGIKHLHGHSCADLAHLLAIADCLGGPGYSLTLHGDLPVYGVDHAAKTARARFVTAVTRPLQKQLLDVAGLELDRTSVITMGVDTEVFKPAIGRGEPVTGRALRLTTIARLNAMKGHAYVLEAVKQARSEGLDITYVIAGDGPHRDAIIQRVSELGLESAVRMVGSLGEQDVVQLLGASDAFVLASEGLGEAAPVSVMEAMSMELPVIVSRIGGTPDMIEDEADGLLIEQADVPALTQAIRRLATDIPYRMRIGRCAREKAVRQFDYRYLASQLSRRIELACSRG